MEEPLEIEELIRRFRANLVISAPESFEEEEWAEISIGALRFQVRTHLPCPSPGLSESFMTPGDRAVFVRL